MQAGSLCVDIAILGWKILDGPVIQGSRMTRKGSAIGAPGSVLDGRGSKERRKEASAFRCFTVSAIAGYIICRGQPGDDWRSPSCCA